MSKVDEEFRQLRLETLEKIKKRRDALDTSIANLEYAIEHPNPPINIDFKAEEEAANRDRSGQ